MSGVPTFETAVPQPTIGPNGLILPTEDAILSGVQTDLSTALGGNLNPSLSTPQGQIATTETAVIGDNYALLAYFMSGIDPATSSGRLQDGLGRIYFLSRIGASATTQPCVCNGLNTTPIPVGALAQDPNTGLLWICQQAGAIGLTGNVTLNFACAQTGPVAGPASLTIAQAISGWESIAPLGDAVLGNNTETASQFEMRRQASVAGNATQILDAIQGQVLALPGVLDCYAYENDLAQTIVSGGVYIGPNSVYICVLGGAQSSIAGAIWSRKGPGCAYTGNTWTPVAAQGMYSSPVPTYAVGYQTAIPVAFAVFVVMANNSGVPSNALSLVQQAIIAGFAGLDGGTRARIGSTVFAARYYSDVASLGPWAQLISIQIGLSGAACTFTGSVTNTTLTVTAVAAGSLSAGLLLQDQGLMAPGTMIVQQLSSTAPGGAPGGTGTYQVSVSQTIASEAMTATALQNDVTVTIAQAPAVSAANIQLLLQTP